MVMKDKNTIYLIKEESPLNNQFSDSRKSNTINVCISKLNLENYYSKNLSPVNHKKYEKADFSSIKNYTGQMKKVSSRVEEEDRLKFYYKNEFNETESTISFIDNLITLGISHNGKNELMPSLISNIWQNNETRLTELGFQGLDLADLSISNEVIH